MKKTLVSLTCVVVLSLVCAAPVDSATVILQYDDATGIDVSAHGFGGGGNNYDGSELYLYGRENWSASTSAATSYLRFVLPWFLHDPGVTVQSAELKTHLYEYGRYSTAPSTATVGCAGVTQSWGEKTLTWNNKPATDGTSTDTVTFTGIPSGWNNPTDQWSQWNVEPLVSDWLDGTRPNYGVILRNETASNPRQTFYYNDASESLIPANRPILEIEFTGEPVVAYREIFPNDGSLNLAPLNTADWKGYKGDLEQFFDTSATDWGTLCISPYGGAGAEPVNSFPAYDSNKGCLYNGRAVSPATEYLYYTEEFQIHTDHMDAFCWNQSITTSDGDGFRAVVQIDGGDWYASEQTITGSDWSVLNVFAFDMANWLELDFTPTAGSSLGLGGPVAPPDGLITAFGLYIDGMGTGEYSRFDNFAIWAVPEPSTLVLLLMGALAAVLGSSRSRHGRRG